LKVEMSSFDVAAVAAELDSSLRGARIDNVYQVNRKILLLKLRGLEGIPPYLLIEAGRRVHTTSYEFEKPKNPPAFSMALRKYLRNGRVVGVRQYEFERILVIDIERGGDRYRLISELFGNGNIILVGGDGRIIQALTYRRMKDRNILRGEEFKYPPPSGRNPRRLERDELDDIRDFGEIAVVRALTRFLSIGGLYAEEILLRAGVEKDKPCGSLTGDELDEIFKSIKDVLNEISPDNMRPCIFIGDEGIWVDVAPTRLKIYERLRCESYESFNGALDEYYAESLIRDRVERVKEKGGEELARLKRRLKEQKKALEALKERAERNRRIGDIIYRHLNELTVLVQRIMEGKRSGRTWNEVTKTLMEERRKGLIPAVYVEAINPKNMTLKVNVEGEAFQLDLRRSVQESAARYYERAKKAGRKIVGAERAIKETLSRIKETKIELTKRVEEAVKPLRKRPKRMWYEKFRWFYSSDGFLVIGGKDASTNEVLIRRYMEPKDVVFHADIPGAPFVVVKSKGKPIPENTLREAAQLAASYSRAWREMLSTMNVYWVTPNQVSMHPPSGEYLPRGSFMIYGHRNYIRKVPVEVAIGVRREEDGWRVIGGPTTAIARRAEAYVRLVPGREPSGRLAKEIRLRLTKLLPDYADEIARIPLEEFQRFIPSGRGEIAESKLTGLE